jgi:integrase
MTKTAELDVAAAAPAPLEKMPKRVWPKAKITKRTVDAANVDPGGRSYVWDTEIKGFGLLVLPSGVKSYIFRYRTPEGVERRATIGKHGTWTPDQARGKADVMRQEVKAGRDPLGEKRSIREAPTVADVLDDYLASARFKEKAPSTQAIDRGRIERHLKPLIGQKHVHTLTTDEIERTLAAIRDGKTAATVKTKKRGKARVTGGETTARDTIGLLRVILNWAKQEGMVKSNPCDHIKLGAHGTRDVILEDATDYARLFQTLDRMEQEKRIRSPVADAIRLIALTGARRGEIANLQWSQVHLERGLIILPRKSHKTGRKTGKPREIGLPAVAKAIIVRQPVGKSDDFVFKPAKGNGAMALSRKWLTIRKEAGLPEGIGLHGLRHSIGSAMAWSGAGAPEIMAALGHSQLATAQRYIHWAQNARWALSERAASVALEGMYAAEAEALRDTAEEQ